MENSKLTKFILFFTLIIFKIYAKSPLDGLSEHRTPLTTAQAREHAALDRESDERIAELDSRVYVGGRPGEATQANFHTMMQSHEERAGQFSRLWNRNLTIKYCALFGFGFGFLLSQSIKPADMVQGGLMVGGLAAGMLLGCCMQQYFTQEMCLSSSKLRYGGLTLGLTPLIIGIIVFVARS